MRFQGKGKFDWRKIFLLIGIVLVVPILAIVNVLVGPYAALPYAGLASLLIFFMLPLDWLLLLAFVMASVIAGLIDYFGHVQQAFWLPYLMGLLFALRALVERIKPWRVGDASLQPAARRAEEFARQGTVHGPRVLTVLSLCYLSIGLFSTVVALPSFGQAFVAAKNYWFMWGVLLVVIWCSWPPRTTRWLWATLIVVACIQWPVAAYQRFFIAAKRTDAAAWDAVVGTLGGNPESGGHSATMALLLCLAIGALLWRMRERRLHPLLGGPLVLACLLPIGLAEVKAAFIWLALVFFLLFARQVLRQPLRATMTLLVGGALLVGMGWVYKTTFYEDRGGSQTLSQIYDKQLKYAFDPDEYRADYGRLGRVAALKFWWQRHDAGSNPLHFFVGHGLGASRGVSALGMGDEARKYSIALDTTGASTLLWDIGLLGCIAFVGLLMAGAAFGLQLSRREDLSAEQRETMFLSGAMLAMSALCVFYNRDPIDTPAVQLLIFFCLGQITLTQRGRVGSVSRLPRQGRGVSGIPSAQVIGKTSTGSLSA